MNFCWCTIGVKDLKESLQFYEEIVGLNLNRKFETGDGREIAFLGSGETQIELIYDPQNRKVDIGPDISLGFEVDSVEEKINFLQERGIDIQSGPFQPNPHIKFFFIKDPNGLKIQFVQNLLVA